MYVMKIMERGAPSLGKASLSPHQMQEVKP
jgi:hypothetical protein